MTGIRGFDLDGETSRAWTAFSRQLADDIAELDEGETLVIGLGGSPGDSSVGSGGGVTLIALGEDLIRYVVKSAEGDVSERVVSRADADSVAAEASHQLREVLGALHPVFLHVSGDRQRSAAKASHAPVDEELLRVVNPTDSAHLFELAVETITEILGHPPVRDDDGDVVIEFGTAQLFIRVLEQAPLVQIFARLVHDLEHPDAAPALISKLNADYPFVRFVLDRQAVLASVHLPALPFVPSQLRYLLSTFGELADTLGGEIVGQLGGQLAIQPADDDVLAPDGPGALPPELMMLVRLDPEGRGLDADITARVCSHDRALARQLLHIAGGQESVWQAAAEEDDDDPSHVTKCIEEAAAWTATRRSLASALRLIDETEAS